MWSPHTEVLQALFPPQSGGGRLWRHEGFFAVRPGAPLNLSYAECPKALSVNPPPGGEEHRVTPTVSTSPSAHCRGGLGSRDPSSLPRRGVGRDRALPAAAPRLSSSGPRGVRQARPSSLFQRGARQGSRLFPGPIALFCRQLPRGSRQLIVNLNFRILNLKFGILNF